MPRRLRQSLLAGVALATLLLAAQPVSAQSAAGESRQDEKFLVMLGLFRPHVTTTIRADSADGEKGTSVDFESNLGLEDNTTSPLVGFAWRFTRRSVLVVSYLDLDRDGIGETDIEIKWDDETIPVNTRVESFFRTEILSVAYGYRFLRTERAEMGVTGGIHVTWLDAGIETLEEPFTETAGAVTAPLPVIGLFGSYSFSSRWNFAGTARLFRLRFGDYEGAIDELSGRFAYRISKNVGVALGLDYFRTRLDADTEDFDGRFNWEYVGPSLYLVLGF